MRILVALLFAAPAIAQVRSEPVDAQGWMNRGVQAYKAANYPEAVQSFRRAVDLSPNDATPRLYLATAYLSQYVPGANSPENVEFARDAEREFQVVLQLDPRNVIALKSLAALSLQQAQGSGGESEKMHHLASAERWHKQVIEVNPADKEPYYSLAVIAWTRAYPEFQRARTQAGMRPEDPGPIRDAAARIDLRSRFEKPLADGIANMDKALQIDPQYDDAMAYLNLLLRLRADLAGDSGQYQRDIGAADEWVRRALEIKKHRAATGMPQSRSTIPPPPPPPASHGSTGPARIRVGSAPQSHKLVHHVPPVYPPEALQARIQGVVRFTATISEAGDVTNLMLVSGHPLLVRAATEAVQQWRYQPTLLNGKPVSVVTQLDVNFVLP